MVKEIMQELESLWAACEFASDADYEFGRVGVWLFKAAALEKHLKHVFGIHATENGWQDPEGWID